jgi:hypothetical protein
MRRRRRLAVIVGIVCLYLAGVGFLSGVLVERVRFDARRAAVLERLSTTEQRLHARLMDLEHRPRGRSGGLER